MDLNVYLIRNNWCHTIYSELKNINTSHSTISDGFIDIIVSFSIDIIRITAEPELDKSTTGKISLAQASISEVYAMSKSIDTKKVNLGSSERERKLYKCSLNSPCVDNLESKSIVTKLRIIERTKHLI